MVVVPYLSEAAIERLLGEEVSGVDLCGNYAIAVPNRWLVVRNDAPNRYPDSGPICFLRRATITDAAKMAAIRNALDRLGYKPIGVNRPRVGAWGQC